MNPKTIEELIKLLEDQRAFNSAIYDICEMLLSTGDARIMRACEAYNEISSRIERLRDAVEKGDTPRNSSQYDDSDPIQKRGFDDAAWNDQHQIENKKAGKMGGFRLNPYSDGSDEYYRWNRGHRAQMWLTP